jgi:hypothetical protein
MADQASTALQQQPAVPLTTSTVIQGMRDNFVLISAAAVITGVVLASVFLAAYLQVFDWHLILFVQYTDIITVGLIAVGIISGSLLFLVNAVMIINNIVTSEGKNRRSQIIIIGVLVALGVAFNLWGAVKGGEGYFHILDGLVVQFIGVAILWLVWSHFKAGVMPRPMDFGRIAFLLIVGAGATGNWLGHSILEVGRPIDIKVKETTLNGVKLIVELSRHTILLKEHDIYIVPTADIAQIHSVAAPYQF